MKTIKYKSPAKINLSLEIVKKLPNGFHQLRSVMMKLPVLHDKLVFGFDDSHREIKIKSNNLEIPSNEKNLCHKAAQAFFGKTKKSIGVEIEIEKRIPVGAGLGGGSSNAATTFFALNDFFGKPLTIDQLVKLASKIGKDIPFFFSQGNVSLVESMGERIKDSLDFSGLHFLLVNPGIHISTPWAYGQLAEDLWYMQNKKRRDISLELVNVMKRGDKCAIASSLYNDFEVSVEKRHPVIGRLKQEMKAFGAVGSLMSGSGSTVFGVFDSRQKMLDVQKILKKQHPDFFVEVG